MDTRTVVNRARVRRHLSTGEKPGGYAPYPGMLHDPETDDRIDWQDAVLKALWSLPEGARVSIVLKTEPPPDDLDPEDYWILVAPHTYKHVRERKG